jgi:hypothetical protein
MACTIPANEPICRALLEKAASYPAEKLYQIRAYHAAAEKLAAVDIDLVAKYGTDQYDAALLHKFGPKALELIDDYCMNAAAEKRRTRMMSAGGGDCFVPDNNGLYNALLYRAAKASNKYAAKHYTDAATKVLSSRRNLPLAWSAGQGEEAIRNLNVGPSIVAYIKYYYLTEAQNREPFKYPTTDDEKAEEALKIYCIKNGYTYSAALLEEYKRERPNVPSWRKKKYNYDTRKSETLTDAEVATVWAQLYSETLRPQPETNKYKQGVINYCKRNNIVYQPLMLERLNAWREANKDTLRVEQWWWGPDAAGKPTSYPLSSTAVIRRWFATLPKTVVL